MSVALDIVYSTLIPFFLRRAIRDREYRPNIGERFGWGSFPRKKRRKRVWIHAASVGELNACRKLIEHLLRESGCDVVVTMNTPAGRRFLDGAFPAVPRRYAPFDFSTIVAHTLRRISPDLIVLVEQELWPNLLETAASSGIPVAVVNGRMTERSWQRCRRSGGVLRRSLRAVAHFAAQNSLYRDRMRGLGIPAERISATGNMKFDVLAARESTGRGIDRMLFGIADADPIVVAGSTHDPEESAVLDALRRLRERLPSSRLILAPRHPNRLDEVEKKIADHGFRWYKRSTFTAGGDSPGPWDVLLLDTMGELAEIYAVADVVFVGGTIAPKGGQNIIEPASLGKPVVTGPSLYNFADIAAELENGGGLVRVADAAALAPTMARLLDERERKSRGEKNREIVRAHAGATERNLEVVRRLLFR